MNELKKLGKAPYHQFEKRMKLSNLVMKFGGIFSQVKGADLERAISASSVYTTQDWENQEVGMRKSIDLLGPQILAFNALKDVPEVRVPVWFIHGKQDRATPGELVEKFFSVLKA